MRNKTMSKRFWEKATKVRVEAMKNGEEDLIDKFHRVVAEVEMEEAAALEREQAEEERKRKEEEANQDATRELTDEERLAIQQHADQAFQVWPRAGHLLYMRACVRLSIGSVLLSLLTHPSLPPKQPGNGK